MYYSRWARFLAFLRKIYISVGFTSMRNPSDVLVNFTVAYGVKFTAMYAAMRWAYDTLTLEPAVKSTLIQMIRAYSRTRGSFDLIISSYKNEVSDVYFPDVDYKARTAITNMVKEIQDRYTLTGSGAMPFN